MKNYNYKILFATVISVLIILGALVGAGVLAKMNLNGFSEEFPQTQYLSKNNSSSKDDNSSSVVSNSSVTGQIESSNSSINQESSWETATVHFNVETGSYFSGADRILIKSSDNGFIEGSILCSGITMEFSGQTVSDTLVATGTDSLNNTVEISLIFKGNTINASSKPLIRYEESVSYLELSGTFKK